MDAGDRTCPSARAAPGAILLGVAGADGRIRPVRTAMTIDADFVAAAARNGPPEARMRFAAPCRTTDCAQWEHGGCGVARKVLAHLAVAADAAAGSLPPCLIRATCRWFDQEGARACAVCDRVVTDQRTLASAKT